MSKESKIGLSALRKPGKTKAKKKKKAACYCRIHPLTSEMLKDPDRDLQPALVGTEYEAENTQMPRGSFCGAREAAFRLHRVMVRAVFFQQVCYC